MLKIILGSLVAIVVAFVVVVALRSNEYKVERKVVIKAPAEKVFALINDFHEWSKWSPWEKYDLTMKKEFSGPTSGVKAAYDWAGNGQVGQGRMTITDSKPNEKIVIALEFFKPYKSSSTTIFTVITGADGTQTVSWIMEGQLNFFMKAMSIFKDMDSMVGKDFEVGLNNLKVVAEK